MTTCHTLQQRMQNDRVGFITDSTVVSPAALWVKTVV
jgi:hypothetical protein